MEIKVQSGAARRSRDFSQVCSVYRKQHSVGPVLTALMLALGATGLSLAIAASVGWQRGTSAQEKYILAAVGILAVLGAHLLLPLCRAAGVGVLSRVAGFLLWIACLAYAAMSHASFFIDAQSQRAEYRVAAVAATSQPELMTRPRRLAAVLEDRAALETKWRQARLAYANCDRSCESLNIRQSGLQSRLAALEAEADEVRRWQFSSDQLQQLRGTARDDPVTARLAQALGVTRGVAEAVTVLPVAVILEGMGGLCWLVAFNLVAAPVAATKRYAATGELTGGAVDDGLESYRPMPVTDQVMDAVTAPATQQVPLGLDRNSPQPVQASDCQQTEGANSAHIRALATKVWAEVQQGQLKPTVREIRAHLQIAQEQARAVAEIVRRWRSMEEAGLSSSG